MHTMSTQAKLASEAPVAVAISVLAMLLLPFTAVAGEQPPYKPLVAPLTKDPTTSLYTIAIKNDAPLVVDLAGSLVWSTCPSSHSAVPCQSGACRAANEQRPRRCRYVDAGWFGASREPAGGCACTGSPVNPVTGECSTGDLTSFAMSANATDGRSALHPVELPAVVGSCAPERLLRSLPAGAAGVAGFSRRPLSLPSQLAARRAFGNKFALCLPGAAVFGDTPVVLAPYLPNLTAAIPYAPLLRHPRNGAHYLPVKRIAVHWDQAVEVPLPAGALDLDAGTGRGGVALSTVTPYMAMRRDVHRAFVKAYDTAVRGKSYAVERVAAVRPFELCYNGGTLRPQKRFGLDAPSISLEVEGAAPAPARPWWVPSANYLVSVGGGVVCAGVVEMAQAAAAEEEDEPAMVIGGMQMENHLVVLDLDKGEVGFSDLLWYMGTSCSAFNFSGATST